ncbi:hypothetical protein [Pseudomonas sp. SDI]|uniref:hypothetical protein n=1 Tax=Pseudomonas sp. SDI TaxID=2170734 RepID=UPI00105832B2|nr:hypothetical protein [Pseudomonas sp. SDI]
MKKRVPDPPVLSVRRGLSRTEALAHAAEHLNCAVNIAKQAVNPDTPSMTLVRAAIFQVEVAAELVQASFSAPPEPR